MPKIEIYAQKFSINCKRLYNLNWETRSLFRRLETELQTEHIVLFRHATLIKYVRVINNPSAVQNWFILIWSYSSFLLF